MARRSMLTAAACAALATALYLAVVHLALAQRADMSVLARTMDHNTPERATLASDLVTLFNPLPFMIFACALVGGAVLAGRFRAGLVAAAALVGANVTTQVLKPLLAVQRPYPSDHYMAAAAWPSGHTTAIVSLLLALVIVLPPRLRPTAAVLGGVFAAATLGSIVLLGYHYPSDVLGGILVAGAWAAPAFALSGSGRAPTAAQARPLPRSRRATG
jgi:membrane-associated phospholipid phosphatase